MKENFGTLPTGEAASLYTISCQRLSISVTDYGAALVRVMVPDRNGEVADVVLGYDDVSGYAGGSAFLGSTVGRNANRIKNSTFSLNGTPVHLTPNENSNNLHSGPDFLHTRLWKVFSVSDDSVIFHIHSQDGDQGFPGNASVFVSYALENPATLRITYRAIADQDTVFNFTNHSYFNLAGQQNTDAAIRQILTLPARFFNPDDEENIPTGELRPVDGTPMDFREPKPICQDIGADYEPLKLQGGYDHNFEAFTIPCAILTDPGSGRTMAITTDCPGIQFYSGNFLDETGKGNVHYGPHSGIALETQFYPDSLNHPEWPQPIVPANTSWRSETKYTFSV